jgi:SNF2 family DNA or RNA helicase
MGLNLQVGSYAIFYESPVGVIPRAEAEGRIHRTGQQNRCFIYDLVVKDSVDELILNFHKTGGDLWKALVDNPQKTLNLRK